MNKNLALVSADKEILELARECGGYNLIGFFDRNPQATCLDLAFLGDDAAWNRELKTRPDLQVALAVDPPPAKARLAKHYGLDKLVSLISKEAYVSPSAVVAAGCLLQRGVHVMAAARIGSACKLNLNAVVHHDCVIGDYCTLAPGCLVLGAVTVENEVFIGAGAIILPKIRIGRGAVIGAGAVVVEDVPAGIVAKGVPARNSQGTK